MPGSQPQTGAAAWRVGDRVLSPWHDQYLYPATVAAVHADGYLVRYDDGDQLVVPGPLLRTIVVEPGEQIFIRPHAETRLMYHPAVVLRVAGESLDVRFEETPYQHAHVETGLPVGRARFLRGQAAPAPAPAPAAEPEPGLYGIGDRVLARWLDLFWYPGTVIALEAGGVRVLYDDGDQRTVSEPDLMPLAVEEGEHVHVRPRFESRLVYYPAVVTRAAGEVLDVEFESSELMEAHAEANLRVGRVRIWRCPRRVAPLPWHEADRVFLLHHDGYWYPAEIVSVEEDRIGVQLLFGGDLFVTPELIRKLEADVGARVECRWRGEPDYSPGTITQKQGDKIHVDHDDGRKGWSVVRLIRVRFEKKREG